MHCFSSGEIERMRTLMETYQDTPMERERESMIRDDFQIGMEFYTATGKWRCTDVGTRVVVAIRLDKDDVSWYAGPPFAVSEWVFDEYDLAGCSLDAGDFEMRQIQECGGDADNPIPN